METDERPFRKSVSASFAALIIALRHSIRRSATAALRKFRRKQHQRITNGRSPDRPVLGKWPFPIPSTGGSESRRERHIFDFIAGKRSVKFQRLEAASCH